MNRIYILDSRDKWIEPLLNAARERGYRGKRIRSAQDVDESGYALIFPHAHPATLKQDQQVAAQVAKTCTLITDIDQIMLYEDKRGQTRRWHHLMPATWILQDRDQALAFAETAEYPLISKADVGASSYNVRLLKSREDGIRHIQELFGSGIRVEHCDSQGTRSVQKGYAILQEFVPHEITYRVNVIGGQRAIFYRYCYPDRPMAQTGNVKPAYSLDDETHRLLAWVDSILPELNTKWAALDILKCGDTWRLLETSLRWPWPSPGDCNNGAFFPGGRKWIDLWQVLFDEIEAGQW